MFQIRGIGAIKRHRFLLFTELRKVGGPCDEGCEPPLRPVLEAPDDTSNTTNICRYTMYTIQDISTIDIAQSAEDAEQA